MTVTAQYAQAHFHELLIGAQQREEIRIDRGEKPAVQLALATEDSKAELPVTRRPRSEFIGSAEGKIWLSEDWDSPEANAEIADLFENSVLFPTER